MKSRIPLLALVTYNLLFLSCIVLATGSSCGAGTQQTIKKDAIGCGMSIALSTYVQIPSVFAGDDWQTKAKALGTEIGMEALQCAAKDVLAILTAKATAGGPSTAAPEPVVVHLQAFLKDGVK